MARYGGVFRRCLKGSSTLFRASLGALLGGLARVWLRSLRLRVVTHPALEQCRARPWVLVFFHGTQWPLLAWPRRRSTVVLVSHSSDGAMQAQALRSLGLRVVRGSSSRGGALGLMAVVRIMKREGADAAFAVDGPRGPYGAAKPGAEMAARHAGAVLVPMGSAITHGKRFVRAWDKFALAWPFTRVAVVLGAPISTPVSACSNGIAETEDVSRELENAIAEANRVAATLV